MQDTGSRVVNASETGERAAARLAVVELRQRIENIAVDAVRDSFPSQPVAVPRVRIRERLIFVAVAYDGGLNRRELFGLIGLVRHIYARTSDVLHGRSSMLNVSPALLHEWEIAVSTLERLTRQ